MHPRLSSAKLDHLLEFSDPHQHLPVLFAAEVVVVSSRVPRIEGVVAEGQAQTSIVI